MRDNLRVHVCTSITGSGWILFRMRKVLGSVVEEITKQILCWIKRDQLDVTCYFISLFNAQYVPDVNTSILRSLRLICYFVGCIVLVQYVLVLRCGLAGMVWYSDAGFSHDITQQICSKLLRRDILTSKTYWALNNEIK